MKNVRFFLLFALVISGIILYMFYKSGRFINKKINTQTLLAQDSMINTQEPTPLMIDTFSLPSTTSTHPVVVPPSQIESVKKAAASTPPKPLPKLQPKPLPEANNISSNQLKIEVQKKMQTTKPTELTVAKARSKDDLATDSKSKNASAASEQRYHVIVGSFKEKANAAAKALVFEQKNHKKATIIKQDGYFRVSADAFEFAQSAAQYAQKLKGTGENSIVLKF